MTENSVLKIIKIINGVETTLGEIKGDEDSLKKFKNHFEKVFIVPPNSLSLAIQQSIILQNKPKGLVLVIPENIEKNKEPLSNLLKFCEFDLIKLLEPKMMTSPERQPLSPKAFGKNKLNQKKWYNR